MEGTLSDSKKGTHEKTNTSSVLLVSLRSSFPKRETVIPPNLHWGSKQRLSMPIMWQGIRDDSNHLLDELWL